MFPENFGKELNCSLVISKKNFFFNMTVLRFALYLCFTQVTFFKTCIYFVCFGSSLLHRGLSLLWRARATL